MEDSDLDMPSASEWECLRHYYKQMINPAMQAIDSERHPSIEKIVREDRDR